MSIIEHSGPLAFGFSLTLLPLNTNNELDVPVDRVVSQDTSSGRDCAAQADLRVDVER